MQRRTNLGSSKTQDQKKRECMCFTDEWGTFCFVYQGYFLPRKSEKENPKEKTFSLGKYTLGELIGEGVFSQVFKAKARGKEEMYFIYYRT